MEAQKIVGGILAGIGSVVALPIMGSIGSVSILGAILGGTVGGLAGAVISEKDEDGFRDARRSASQDEDVNEDRELDKWFVALEEARENLQDNDAFYLLLTTLGALGSISSKIRQGGRYFGCSTWVNEMDEGIEKLDLPDNVREELNQLKLRFGQNFASDEKDIATPTLLTVIEMIRRLEEPVRQQVLVLLDQLIPEASGSALGGIDLEITDLIKSLIRNGFKAAE